MRTRGPPPSSGGDDQVGQAVAVDVPGRDVDPAGECGLERVDRKQLGLRDAVEDADARRPAGAGADDQVGDAVAVEVGRGGADAADSPREQCAGEPRGLIGVEQLSRVTAALVEPHGELAGQARRG